MLASSASPLCYNTPLISCWPFTFPSSQFPAGSVCQASILQVGMINVVCFWRRQWGLFYDTCKAAKPQQTHWLACCQATWGKPIRKTAVPVWFPVCEGKTDKMSHLSFITEYWQTHWKINLPHNHYSILFITLTVSGRLILPITSTPLDFFKRREIKRQRKLVPSKKWMCSTKVRYHLVERRRITAYKSLAQEPTYCLPTTKLSALTLVSRW